MAKTVIIATVLFAAAAQAPVPAGITRTTLRDDAKATVSWVLFAPGAAETPHTHPNDIILVPVTGGPIEAAIGDKAFTELKPGDVQFVARDVVHFVKTTVTQNLEFIVIALK